MKHVRLLAVLNMTCLGTIATAQTSTPKPEFPPLVGGSDFISPMGEPFHSNDRLSGAEHWFAAADSNHDGRLTRDEFMADGHRFFTSLDVNHDGEIGLEEVERYETVIAPEIRVGLSDEAPPPTSGDDSSNQQAPAYPTRLGAGRFGYLDITEPVIAMDTNIDRSVSREEFDRAARQRFAMLDANGDGAITRDELPKLSAAAVPKKRGGGHHKHRGGGNGM